MFPSAVLPSSGLAGRLYHKEHMPEHFHEHFIVTGYRHPRCSAWRCVLSLFDLTNETLNFWTHFLPSWYFMWVLRGLAADTLDFRRDPYSWPLLCYLFACCVFPLASAVAHTFNVMSARARHVCFFLDYSALSLFAFGVAVSYHAYCFPQVLVGTWFYRVYVHGAGVCAFLCTASSCMTRFMRPSALRQCLRLLAFCVPYWFNSFPIACRLFLYSPDEGALSSQGLHAWQFAFAILAAFLYASHLPERWQPGRFDIIGHSHQLFHVATILGVVCQLRAVLLDMHERQAVVRHWAPFRLTDSLGPMALVLAVNTALVVAFSLRLYRATPLLPLPAAVAADNPPGVHSGGKLKRS